MDLQTIGVQEVSVANEKECKGRKECEIAGISKPVEVICVILCRNSLPPKERKK